MAILRAKEVRTMSKDDLKQQLLKLRSELSRDRGAIASGTRPENTGRVKELRRTIARIHTIQHQKAMKKEEGSKKNG